MTTFQGKTGRKITGARLRSQSAKKKRELGRAATRTAIGVTRRKEVRTHGGNTKHRLYRAEVANVVDPSTGKITSAEIKDVDNNPASREFSRRRIITKGAIIETSAGNARVTNRPGNEGFVNAVLVE
ncbi:MAG: 30S ribosomal protein S8e [Candidatus Kariarchaeaceae archaeon]|jgi:small subunit ribosomal protein S8e